MLAKTTPPHSAYTHKRGRPRKLNVRRAPSGKSLGEVVDLAPMFEQPHRRGAKDPKDDRLGYPLGRLRLRDQISELQHRAGNEWALLVRAYAGVMGIPVGSTRSGSAHPEIASGSMAVRSAPEGSEEHTRRVADLRSRYNACFERLASIGRSVGRGHSIIVAVRRVCIEEVMPSDGELGNLRLGLNALSHELKISD